MTDIDCAWAAGLFEGEGTVRINRPTRRNTGHLAVSVVSTDIDVVSFFQDRWPGYMKEATGLDPARQRRAWVWNIAAKRAAVFLNDIIPFVRTDRVIEKIAWGLRFQAQKTDSRENRTEEYRDRQWWFYERMRELNHRGTKPMVLRDRS